MFSRIYHTEISSKKRWVWREDGYSPSEPIFVSSPDPTSEDDGVILSLVSPYDSRDDKNEFKPFLLILNGRDLTELARAYFPEEYSIPIGFHGTWVKQ